MLPFLRYTHTHTHAYTRTRTHTHAHTCTHTPVCTCSCAPLPSFTFFLGLAARRHFRPDAEASQQGCSQVCPTQRHRLCTVQLRERHSERLGCDRHVWRDASWPPWLLLSLFEMYDLGSLSLLSSATSKMKKLIQKMWSLVKRRGREYYPHKGIPPRAFTADETGSKTFTGISSFSKDETYKNVHCLLPHYGPQHLVRARGWGQ